MKRNIIYMFSVMLSMGLLTGCGTPSASKLVDDMREAEISSAKMNIESKVDVESEGYDDISLNLSLDMEVCVSGLDDVDNLTASFSGNLEYDMLDGMIEGDEDIKSYIVGDDGDYKYYFDEQDWHYMEGDLEEITYNLMNMELSEDVIDELKDASMEVWKNATVEKETTEIGGVKCYVLTTTPTGEEWCNLLERVYEASDEEDYFEDMLENIEDEYDVTLEEVLDEAGVSLDLYITKKDHLFAGFSVDMSKLGIEDMLDVMDMDIEDFGDELGLDIDELEINDWMFSITLEDINNTEVDIPKKVTKNAKEYSGANINYSVSGGGDADPYYEIDEDDQDVLDVAASTSSGNHVNEQTGEFTMCTFSGREVYTYSIPAGYELNYATDDGTYYALTDGGFYYTYIDIYADLSVSDYVTKGEMPSEEWYPDFECQYKECEYDGVTFYIVYYSYYLGPEWGDYSELGIYVPYVDDYGFDQFMEIQLSGDFKEKYSYDSKEVETFACEILGLN